MDRQIVYPGAVPLETDLLNTNKYSLIGQAKLAFGLLGAGPYLNALACTQTGPASMQVQVAPGEIYSMQNIDGTAYSSLAADTTHTILKQGISLDNVLLSCPAPATAGNSINYLVQVTYQDIDGNAVVLPYYNASAPATAYSGPANSGTAQNTIRQGKCTIAVKAGVSAATGSQVTPAPDAGYTGAYVVTVANGATTIVNGNITTYSGAPFITETLTQKIGTVTGDARYAKLAGLATQVFSVADGAAVNQAVHFGQSFAIGQTYVDVTASRALNTTYTNSTGKAIEATVTISTASGGSYNFNVNGVQITTFSAPIGIYASSFVIPAGATYQAAAVNSTLSKWFELR